MAKALPKALQLPRQVNVKLPSEGLRMESKSPVVPRHCRDDAEVKTWHLSPAMTPAIPDPMGARLTYDWCITI